MGILKSWRQREAEGDISAQVRRERAAADAETRWEATGDHDDFHAWQALQDLAAHHWED